MPQIIAWQCPRTSTVFTEKSAYVKHLRQLGAQRFVSRGIERSWSALKETANSPEDVFAWLEQNGRALMHMGRTLEALAITPSERIFVGAELDNKAVIRNARKGPSAVILSEGLAVELDCDITLPKRYIKLLVRSINKLGGVFDSGCHELGAPPSTFRVFLSFSVEQWRFAVPYKLYVMSKEHSCGGALSLNDPERARYTGDLLAKFYPQLSLEMLVTHLPVIDLLDDLASFTQWLEQFKRGQAQEKTTQLPEGLNGMYSA